MPRSDGGTTLDEITRADIEASRVLAAGDWKPDVTLVKVRLCLWEDCGGSVLRGVHPLGPADAEAV
jgi:hypothetical protein